MRVNPYYCYALSFLVALVVYLQNWSQLYPSLRVSLVLFLVLTAFAHVVMGMKFNGEARARLAEVAVDGHRTHILITGFLYLLWMLEFFYAGGIPLLMILFGEPYDYRTFGIPSLHVFAVTFSSFYTIFLFHLYLTSRSRIFLLLYLVNLVAAILIYSRAMFFFNLSSSFLLFLVLRAKPSWRLLFITIIGLPVLLFLFGVLGTVRVSFESRRHYDNTLFLDTGEATPEFRESMVPKEFFWTYIYVSSPLANLQTNINLNKKYDESPGNFALMVNNEMLMDFISKRVNRLTGIERTDEARISGPFNVSTVYSRCFSYMGWTGMFIMAIFLLWLPWLYFKLIPKGSPFFYTSLAILSTGYLFLAYDNMIRFTGFSFQLVYPIVLHYLPRKLNILPRLGTRIS